MESYIAGLDESGRGPVIGALVICCAYCKREHEKKLNKVAKKDSKALSAKQRKETFDELRKFCEFKWVEVSAFDLNELMERMSLNDIEAQVMASLVSKLKNADVMIDMPDRYSWTFRKRMKKFGCERFEAEHKADENYPIVAAASICAKLIRDEKIEKIKKEVGFDFGSGYPSDERTRDALRNRGALEKLKPFIRKKWKTLDTVKQRKLFEE